MSVRWCGPSADSRSECLAPGRAMQQRAFQPWFASLSKAGVSLGRGSAGHREGVGGHGVQVGVLLLPSGFQTDDGTLASLRARRFADALMLC